MIDTPPNFPQTIAILVNHLAYGGAARITCILSSAWVERGSHVVVFTGASSGAPSPFPIHPNVVHQPLDLQRDSRNLSQAILHNFRRVLRLRRALRKLEPSLVISFLDTNNITCLLATRGMKQLPVIISERTDPHGRPLGFFWEQLRRLTYPWANCLVVQTRHALDFFPSRVQTKGLVIPNPVIRPSRARRHQLRDPGPRKVLLTLGRLDPVKGHDLLIEAFSRISSRHPDWDLWIYGEGPRREALEAQVRGLHLEDRIFLPGNTVSPEEKLHEADVFTLPSRTEGFPNALAEAMAAGLPVVSFDCPSGPAELIRHGLDGLLVPPEDPAGLAEALDDLMSHPEKRARMGAQARDVLQRFDCTKILDQWEALLRRHTVIQSNHGSEKGAPR